MEISNQRIAELIIRQLRQQPITAAEQSELQEWMELSDENREIYQQLKDPDKLNELLNEYDDVRSSIWSKVDAGLKASEQDIDTHTIKRRRIGRYVAAAALLFVLITSYIWLASLFHATSKARPASMSIVAQDVAPGGDKATLTLGNGSTVVLENVADGSLGRQGNAQVLKVKNQLAYTAGASSSEILYNTLTTPRAGQYQLVLPDQTKVWLNNASTLRYPTSFSGSAREVTLTGEAYFEVAKSSKPFTLKLKGLSVDVLGTSFNVMSYDDEPSVRTTLLTGKISISASGQQTILSPGQQAILDTGTGKVNVVSDVDPDDAIAWKRGYFNFKHATIRDILRQLSRWYDVDVEYATSVPDDYTSDGDIGRDLKLSTILKHLERPDLHFRIEGRKLIVSK